MAVLCWAVVLVAVAMAVLCWAVVLMAIRALRVKERPARLRCLRAHSRTAMGDCWGCTCTAFFFVFYIGRRSLRQPSLLQAGHTASAHTQAQASWCSPALQRHINNFPELLQADAGLWARVSQCPDVAQLLSG